MKLDTFKLSIITINYNNMNGLQNTFESVFSQTYNEFEYLVIDGGSTDGSKELIETNSGNIDFWVSENDNGIYHAMNKGILRSKGEFLFFLNSGDIFHQNKILESIIHKFNHADILYGNIEYSNGLKLNSPSEVDFSFFYYNTLPHQATFISRKLFDQIGLYDENLKIVSDYKFFIIAFCKLNCTSKYFNISIAIQEVDGISSIKENLSIISGERSIVLKENFPLFVKNYEEYFRLKTIEYSKPIKLLRFLGFMKNYFK